MKLLFCITLVVCGSMSYGQTNYYRYDSRTGTSEKIGYSEPSNSQPTFAPYQSKIDLNTYARVGMELQRRYDANVQQIQTLVNNIQSSLSEIAEYDYSFYSGTNDNLDKYLKSISRYDFGKNDVFNRVYNTLNGFYNELQSNKRIIIDNYYKSKYQEEQKKNANTNTDVRQTVDTRPSEMKGDVQVLDYAVIVDSPFSHTVVGYPINNQVHIIRKEESGYYYVKNSKNVIGYMSQSFIIKEIH